jgi:hypothetical protein
VRLSSGTQEVEFSHRSAGLLSGPAWQATCDTAHCFTASGSAEGYHATMLLDLARSCTGLAWRPSLDQDPRSVSPTCSVLTLPHTVTEPSSRHTTTDVPHSFVCMTLCSFHPCLLLLLPLCLSIYHPAGCDRQRDHPEARTG